MRCARHKLPLSALLVLYSSASAIRLSLAARSLIAKLGQ